MAQRKGGSRRVAKSFADLGKVVAANSMDDALAALERGDVRAAFGSANRALSLHPKPAERRRLAEVFYAFGKFQTSQGEFGEAASAFRKAVECDDRNETLRLRQRTAKRALETASRRVVERDGLPAVELTQPDEIRRWDIVTFKEDMGTTGNVSISTPPRAAILYYVQQGGYLHPPTMALPEHGSLDEFHALGIYRWQGDARSGDDFSRWVRRMKDGDRTVGEHLGQLLADWIWSETDCVKDTDFLATVPGDPQREAQRRFNPPRVLADAVERHLGIPILTDVLERVDATHARDLTYREIRRCFALGRAGTQVGGRSIVLVDDVATRGYTLRACSEHLRSAGARRVVCVVVAQSITTHRERRGY